MKKKLTIAGICFAIMLSCSGLSSAAFASNVSEYISPCADGEESYIETLQAMDTYAFVNKLRLDFASAEKANDELALICAASALYERYYELSESEILAQVMDNSTAETLRVTYIQLYYNSFSFESVSKILRLLEIDDVPEALKICIIDYLLPEDSQTMDNLLENGESRMAFHAIKRLAKLNPSKGFDYAEKLLKNYQDYDEGRVRAALIVLGRSNDSLHQKLVLETSEALLNIQQSEVMLDTIASTLSKPHSYEAIKLVIDNDEFDKCMKAMIIDRNYTVLNEVISSEPTLEDIDFVLCCMELYPINDLFQPLSEAIANLPNAQNASFSVDYQMVLDKIQENGIDANPKWLAN